jgi:hypothetical protein
VLKGMPADAWTARRKWANSRCPGATLFLGWHIHMQTQMHKQLGRHHKAVMQCLMDHTGGGGPVLPERPLNANGSHTGAFSICMPTHSDQVRDPLQSLHSNHPDVILVTCALAPHTPRLLAPPPTLSTPRMPPMCRYACQPYSFKYPTLSCPAQPLSTCKSYVSLGGSCGTMAAEDPTLCCAGG